MAFDKAKLSEIYKKVLANTTPQPQNKDDVVLIVDGMNNFLRCWAGSPIVDDNGIPNGGVAGFLLSLGEAIKLLKPTRVIIIFDGKGGSARRKKLYPDYKEKRTMPVRINRLDKESIDLGEEKNHMYAQMAKLMTLLKTLPVSIMTIDYIEADDAIAYLCTGIFKNKAKMLYIMSTDKDFYQLVSSSVNVWSPIKKCIYNEAKILEEFGIHPTNFPLYRIFDGDASDNITGVTGVGIKSVVKYFPFVKDPIHKSINELVQYAKDRLNEGKIYTKTIDNLDVLNRNYTLMQLQNADFSSVLQTQIIDSMEKIYSYSKMDFMRYACDYAMITNIPNVNTWLSACFDKLQHYAINSDPK